MPQILDLPDILTEKKGDVKLEPLPRYAVILHNDDVHDMFEVVLILIETLRFTVEKATRHMLEAHYSGRSTVMVTHFERAELYKEKLIAKTLSATIEKLD